MQFKDGSHGGVVLLPVSYLMSLYFSEVQNLFTNQISSTYLNFQLRYNYFRFGKTTVCHTGFYFRFRFLPYHVVLGCRISSKSLHPQWRYDDMMLYVFSRWRLLRRNFTSGFVVVFRMSISITHSLTHCCA